MPARPLPRRLPPHPLTVFKASTCSVSSSSSTLKVKERVWPESSQPARASAFAWGTLVEGTARGGGSKAPLSPPPGRGPPRGGRASVSGREGLGKARGPRPTPTSPGRAPQPDAHPPRTTLPFPCSIPKKKLSIVTGAGTLRPATPAARARLSCCRNAKAAAAPAAMLKRPCEPRPHARNAAPRPVPAPPP